MFGGAFLSTAPNEEETARPSANPPAQNHPGGDGATTKRPLISPWWHAFN